MIVWFHTPAEDPGAVERAYHRISAVLADTPGLVRSEFLRSRLDPQSVAVMSEWTSLEAFERWEEGPDHRASTAPLRPYQDHDHGPVFAVYEVAAAHQNAGKDSSASCSSPRG
ncbi:antibiotic biosynthesis monooxygenase family protein [Wenjunlia tyrosinilytica]|uniref:antibiotic biosynthesis monooxygenase family protein n=1 Tax=Wenjunlia tyrosinilytica TaxID=1544741 RepID=UPI001E484F9E|nr:antibiotic biosynthesis monooxygenase [Wenjunlia tyrosinilytica]